MLYRSLLKGHILCPSRKKSKKTKQTSSAQIGSGLAALVVGKETESKLKGNPRRAAPSRQSGRASIECVHYLIEERSKERWHST
jgi:hypothetical protein